MDPEKALTLGALGIVLLGAVVPGVGLDLVAVLALSGLVIGGVLTPEGAAMGFGNTTILTVAGMFVLAEALQQTGAVEFVRRLTERAGRVGSRRLLVTLLPIVMVLSAVMNNTGVVVLLLPVLLSVSARLGIPPSRLLIPLSFAAILGGTLTLVGTTTNLLVDGILRGTGQPGFDLLSFAPVGLAFCAIGLVYLVVVSPRLLPDRVGPTSLLPRKQRSDYLTEVVLGEDSRLAGRTLASLPDLTEHIRFLELVRGEETIWPPFQEHTLQAGDLLMVKGKPEDIVKLIQQPGLSGPPDQETGGRIHDVNLDLAEVIIAPGSRLNGATVHSARLRERFGVVVLAVLRREAHLREHLGSLTMRVGDTLLVQGQQEDIERVAASADDLILLGGPPPKAARVRKARFAAIVVALALASAASGLVPLPIAALIGGAIVVVGGCMDSGTAYRAVDLRILLVIGAMLGVGRAVYDTGLAQDIAGALLNVGGAWGPWGLLAAVYLATALLTELVTNAGTAGIMVPIALKTADLAEVNYMPFVMAVALAASCSLLTPIGYQTNLLVYGPGGYRFYDYTRVGLPLAILLWITAVLLLPIVFPF